MQREIAAYLREIGKRYVCSKRHTVQVDFLGYLAELTKERAAGAKRRGRCRARPTEPAGAAAGS